LSKYLAEHDIPEELKYALTLSFNNKELTPTRVQYTKYLANFTGPFVKNGYPYDLTIKDNQHIKSLYLAIIRQESNFDQSAVSSAGAIGLMQLIPPTAKSCAKVLGLPHNAFKRDPKANVAKGIYYLDCLVGNFENFIPAIAAYNAGEGAVKRWIIRYGDPSEITSIYEMIDWIESIPYAETRLYVKKVLENVVVYEKIFAPNRSYKDIFNSFLGKK
jgi:soluble lytic murein transglycosylase